MRFLFILLLGWLTTPSTEAQTGIASLDSLFNYIEQANSKTLPFELTRKKLAQLTPTGSALWQPQYYTTYLYVTQAFEEKGNKIDQTLLPVPDFIQRLYKTNAPKDEIYVLHAMYHQARIGAAPLQRGMSGVEAAENLLVQAEKINSSNPRLYFVRAMGIYHTPALFGGGKRKALPVFQKAHALYQKEKANGVPRWGSKQTLEMIEICK